MTSHSNRAMSKIAFHTIVVSIGLLVSLVFGVRILWINILAKPVLNAVAFNPDSSMLVAAGGWATPHREDELNGALWLWDVKTGTLLKRVVIPGNNICSFNFSHLPVILVAKQCNANILCVDLDTSRIFRDEQLIHDYNNGNGFSIKLVTRILATKFGQQWAIIASNKATTLLWKSDGNLFLKNGNNPLLPLSGLKESSPPKAAFFSQSNKRVVTISDNRSRFTIWSDNGKHLWSYKSPYERIRYCTFSNDSRLIAACFWDYSVRVWNVKSEKELGQFKPK